MQIAAVSSIKQRGVAIFMVLGIIGVMAVLAIFVSKFSSSQRGQIVKNINDAQADFLLRAAIDIALSKAMREGNDFLNYDDSAATPDMTKHPMFVLKQPMQKTGSASGSADRELAIPTVKSFVYDKTDINLDTLADAMGAKINDLKVEFVIDKAMSVEPSTAGYQVVMHDIKPFMRSPTRNYVMNGVVSPWSISLPTFKISDLLTFPLEIAILPPSPTPKVTIPLPIGKAIDTILGATTGFTLPEIKMDDVFNTLLGGATGISFPININITIPSSACKDFSGLYPGLASPSSGEDPNKDWTSEKYGLVKVKAVLDFVSDRRLDYKRAATTTVEFKVSDCQGIAPLYSFFIANTGNTLDEGCFYKAPAGIATSIEKGRRLYVNSTPLSFYMKMAGSLSGLNANLTVNDFQEFDFPGLIRVNGTGEYKVNLSWFRMPSSFNLIEPARDFSHLMLNVATMIPKFKTNTLLGMALETALAAIVSLGTAAIVSLATGGDPMDAIKNAIQTNWKTWLKAGGSTWHWPPGYFPSVMGNFTSSEPSVDFSLVFLPNPFDRGNTTFLFGDYYLFPTLWREVEGNVKKRWFEWCLFILKGLLSALDPIPPIPIPIMIMEEKTNKYAFSSQSAIPSATDIIMDNISAITKPPGYSTGSNTPLSPHPDVPSDAEPIDAASDPTARVPELYDMDQYRKKAVLYYTTQSEFADDFMNYHDGTYWNIPGVICLDSASEAFVFPPDTCPDAELFIKGRGVIVTNGTLFVVRNVLQGNWTANSDNFKREPDLSDTNNVKLRKNSGLALIAREKFIGFNPPSGSKQIVEASCYSHLGMVAPELLKIFGNLVIDDMVEPVASGGLKSGIGDELVIEYKSNRTSVSFFSLKPGEGKFDPRRYSLSFGQKSGTVFGRE